MKITVRKTSLAGVTLIIVGLLTLFFNKIYTANCVMPCGYFDGTRDVVIKIGIGSFAAGLVALVCSVSLAITRPKVRGE